MPKKTPPEAVMEHEETKLIKNWHQCFGAFLARRFQPTDIQVEVEVSASKSPPVFDILLQRHQQLPTWTETQRAVLPDGIRDAGAHRIVIEFKLTERLDANAVHQANIYDVLYRKSQKLRADQVCTFLICSIPPGKRNLKALSFEPTVHQGVYQSTNPLSTRIHIISLNDLSTASHNTAFKLFASKKTVRRAALAQLNNNPSGLPEEALWFAQAMRITWHRKGGTSMFPEISEAEFIEIGKSLGKGIIKRASIEERLEGISAKDILKGISTKDILNGISIPERLESIPIKQRIESIPAQVLIEEMDEDTLAELLNRLPAEKAKRIMLKLRIN